MLSKPGTTRLDFFFGDLKRPLTNLALCLGENTVGCLSYASKLFHGLMISLASVFVNAIWESVNDTKKVAKAFALNKA